MVQRLTVLQMLPALNGGGVERGTLEVAQALVERGHRSLVMSNGGRMVGELEAAGSEHLSWPVHRKSLWSLRHVRPLRRLLSAQGVDVLHARSRAPAWIAWLAWRGMPVDRRPRFVTTVHGLHSVNAYSRIMTRGERVIVVSNTSRAYVLDNYPGVDPGRLRLIPRGVDPAAFPHGYRPSDEWLGRWYEAYPQLRGKQVLTLPGRITRLKGHHDFIGLVDGLRARGHQVHGLIVGGEDPKRLAYAQELRERVAATGLDQHLSFTGHRDDMREIYAVSDQVFSLSTKPESFGRTVLEALTLGRPVIGYDHGGVGEVLADIFPHGLVGLSDSAALLSRTIDLLQEQQAVPNRNRFTLARMLEDTLALYQDLAS